MSFTLYSYLIYGKIHCLLFDLPPNVDQKVDYFKPLLRPARFLMRPCIHNMIPTVAGKNFAVLPKVRPLLCYSFLEMSSSQMESDIYC